MTPGTDSRLERALRRDRVAVLAALLAIAALAWGWLVWSHAAMDMAPASPDGTKAVGELAGMDGMAGRGIEPALAPWSAAAFLAMLLMWSVMMVGMMIPSAAPMILIYARIARQAASKGKVFASAGWFASGYLLAWTGFALGATCLQWLLERALLVAPLSASVGPLLGGLLLIVAGLYQWSPLKNTCLTWCQSPFQFIQRHGGFRGDRGGALKLGLRHGLYCIGCCWALMLLLFVGGVMNLIWVAAIAALVLAEKAFPVGRQIARAAGTAMIAVGIALVAGWI